MIRTLRAYFLARLFREKILLVALAHIVFLWHFRSILIVTLPLVLFWIGGCSLIAAATYYLASRFHK